MSYQRTITLTWDNDEEEEVSHQFPAKNEVCHQCEGFGCHLNPSIGEHAYSMEEFFESFPEEEDREQYFMRGGIYDVRCHTCQGNKVILVADEEQMNEEEKVLYSQYEEHQELISQLDAEMRAEAHMERMMGC